MTNRSRLLVPVVLSLLVAACSGGTGAGADEGSTATTTTPADLAGRTFLSTSIEGHELVPGSQVRIAFTPDGLSASGGCNTMGGAYALDGDRLTTDALAMTEMACDEPLMAQDTWLMGVLAAATIDLAGDTLILQAGDVRLVMGDEQALVPDRPLEGTAWTLESIVTGESVSTMAIAAEATLLFADGQVAIATSCNRGNASVEIREATIVVGPIMSTKMACDAERGALESTIFTLLTGEVPYAIDGDLLTLGTAPNQLVYRATAQP